MDDDLRKILRVTVCCRAVVNDRYGVWTAVTENVSARGCLLVTGRLLRAGTVVGVELSSDLFPEELKASGEVMWSSHERMGVGFTGFDARPGALSAEAWLDKVIEFGEVADSSSAWRVVPFVDRSATLRLAQGSGRGGRLVRSTTPASQGTDAVIRLPLRRA
jgi:hypothetical protein